MLFEEKTMKSEKIYEGKVVNLRIDTVELPDKKYSKREIVEHPGAVGIITVTDDNCLILVKQFRKPIERFLLEIPAGKLEVNEEPRETANRELKEETGYSSNKMEYLMEFYTSAGFSNEKVYLFLATDLVEGTPCPDSGEFIEVVKISIEDLLKMVDRGEIVDSKTIIGINLADKYIKNKK